MTEKHQRHNRPKHPLIANRVRVIGGVSSWLLSQFDPSQFKADRWPGCDRWGARGQHRLQPRRCRPTAPRAQGWAAPAWTK